MSEEPCEGEPWGHKWGWVKIYCHIWGNKHPLKANYFRIPSGYPGLPTFVAPWRKPPNARRSPKMWATWTPEVSVAGPTATPRVVWPAACPTNASVWLATERRKESVCPKRGCATWLNGNEFVKPGIGVVRSETLAFSKQAYRVFTSWTEHPMKWKAFRSNIDIS